MTFIHPIECPRKASPELFPQARATAFMNNPSYRAVLPAACGHEATIASFAPDNPITQIETRRHSTIGWPTPNRVAPSILPNRSHHALRIGAQIKPASWLAAGLAPRWRWSTQNRHASATQASPLTGGPNAGHISAPLLRAIRKSAGVAQPPEVSPSDDAVGAARPPKRQRRSSCAKEPADCGVPIRWEF